MKWLTMNIKNQLNVFSKILDKYVRINKQVFIQLFQEKSALKFVKYPKSKLTLKEIKLVLIMEKKKDSSN